MSGRRHYRVGGWHGGAYHLLGVVHGDSAGRPLEDTSRYPLPLLAIYLRCEYLHYLGLMR